MDKAILKKFFISIHENDFLKEAGKGAEVL